MKTWNVMNVIGDDETLEKHLNMLEKDGYKVKQVLLVNTYEYKIIYTSEDIFFTNNYGQGIKEVLD